jgi:hypothetical protein
VNRSGTSPPRVHVTSEPSTTIGDGDVSDLDDAGVTEAADLLVQSSRRRVGDSAGTSTDNGEPRRTHHHRRTRTGGGGASSERNLVDAYMANSDAVGGLLTNQTESSWHNLNIMAGIGYETGSAGSEHHQMQRVISRCGCQLYFCYFNDMMDFDEDTMVKPVSGGKMRARTRNTCHVCVYVQTANTAGVVGQRVENVDTFTLKHNMLEVSTSPQQYDLILDIINKLVLYVDPKKKQVAEKLQTMRFQLQSKSPEELRPRILQMQNAVRDVMARIRALERQTFFLMRDIQKCAGASMSLSADDDEQLQG